jgi:hypothetical protein
MVWPIFPGTINAERRIVPLKREVTNCRRNAKPKTLEVFLPVSIFLSFYG